MEKKIVVEIDGERHVLVDDMEESYQCKDCSLYDYCKDFLCIEVAERKSHFEKERWKPKVGDMVWYIAFNYRDMCFYCFVSHFVSCQSVETRNVFRTEEDAQAICDKLNAAVKPIIDEL